MMMSMQAPESTAEALPDLVNRDGVYYARLGPLITGELLDIALHGVCSEEQARKAAQALMPLGRSRPTVEE